MTRSLAARTLLAAPLVGATLAAGPLQAQTSTMFTAAEEILVRVDVSDLADTLAGALEVEPESVPRSVEVTLPVAAEVCDVTAEQLEQVRSVEQHIECNAVTVSDELTEATRAEIDERSD